MSRILVAGECEQEWLGCGRCAMLDGEDEPISVALQVEIRVAPRVEVSRSSERLSRCALRPVLSRVVDHDYRGVTRTLKLSEMGEDRRHLTDVVLVAAMETDEGIEEQEDRLLLLDCFSEPGLILRGVESQRRYLDGLDRQIFESQSPVACDAFEARPHNVIGVLGEIDDHGAAAVHVEAIEAA